MSNRANFVREQRSLARDRMPPAAAERHIQIEIDLDRTYAAVCGIDLRCPDGLTESINASDFREVKRLLALLDALDDEIFALECEHGVDWSDAWDVEVRRSVATEPSP